LSFAGKRDALPRAAAQHNVSTRAAIVARDNPREGAPRQKIHQLGEKRFAGVHGWHLGKIPNTVRPSSNRHHPFSSATSRQISLSETQIVLNRTAVMWQID
jgi:hypothetical protein